MIGIVQRLWVITTVKSSSVGTAMDHGHVDERVTMDMKMKE